MGRFWGAALVALIPMLGVSLAVLLSPMMPWNDATRYGPVSWSGHLWGIIAFAIPNTIFISAIIFAIAVWLRSTFASFIGIILLLFFYGLTQSLVGNLDNETLSQLADPFGLSVFQIQTKYWTLADKNTMSLTFGSQMLLFNRLIWLSVGLGVLAIACWRFSFAERRTKSRKLDTVVPVSSSTVPIPKVSFHHGANARLKQFWSQFKIDFFTTVKSPVFLVIVFAGMLDTFFSLRSVAQEGFGLSALPVTYSMVDVIRAGLFVYMIAIIVFYAGVLVWKERDAKLDEVYDALPHSTWISYAAKLLAILAIVFIVLIAETAMGVVNQAMAGYTRFQLDVYFKELFLVAFVWLFAYTVLAFFSHIVSPNKYVGYFLFIILTIVNFFGWGLVQVESNLVRFSRVPGHTYSDLFGFAPYAKGLSWYGIYWMLFCVFLSCIGILLWQRGREKGFFNRIRIASSRFQGTMATATCLSLGAWMAVGGWIYYNSHIVNSYVSSEKANLLRSDYEKDFKSLAELPQPRVTKIKFEIDVFPHKRGLVFSGVQTIENKTETPIEKLVVNVADDYETELTIDNATLAEEHEDVNLRIYTFDPPLAPGGTATMEYSVSYFAKGFENSISRIDIVQNGSFFNSQVAPQIGYQSGFELSSKKDRKRFGLGEPVLMPPLDRENLKDRANTYISNSSDWVELETIISTSEDQVAIAPGSLVKYWQEDGRNYYHYKVDHPSLNFFSFISAKYKVQSREWNGVDIEVYYHPEHEWNVSNMLLSIRKSLEYYTENFGPYRHKQARIIEFPRTSSFAQAFPGTMPYSEGIGFIADIKESDDIDMVFYVVAHEMAHQWWAHQVIGANMEGATVLSETLAQYSSLMVMEKEYGRDIMRKFLRYEMDNYLRSRGRELLKENPLVKVSSQQGYIHYRKGSVVMYHLKEMIGEDKVNAALKSLVDKFAYQSAPYPTSLDLVDALREQTPPEHQHLLVDLFEEITLFENRTTKTTYRKLDNGKYEVVLDVECKKLQADEKGEETEVELDDWIEIGAFAKPEGDSKYGKTLHRELVKISEPTRTFTFVVDELPALAGVDPFSLLIDRLPEDNLKKPTVAE